jgi:cytochrome c oxidase subunit 2
MVTARRVPSRPLRLATGLLLLAGGAAASAQESPRLGLPRDVSLDGHRVDSLIHVTIVFTGILFAVMVAWMLYAVFRHGRSHPASTERGDGRKAAIGVLALACGIFFVVDGNLFFHAVDDLDNHFWNFAAAEQTPGAVRIEINAHQWAWDARYAGPDGKFNTADDVVTLNDLRVPVGTPVVLQLTSTDVLHSLYLPNFRVKQDAIPGTVTRLWFQAQETGQFEIGCAQHCGPNHYKMRATLGVLPRAAYDAWAAAASADGRRGFDPDDTAAHWGWEWRRFDR